MSELDDYMKGLSVEDRDDLNYTLDRDEMKRFWRFRRPINDPLVTGYNYVFVTAPELPFTTQSPSFAGIVHQAGVSGIIQKNTRVLGLPGNGNTSIYSNDIVSMLAGEGPGLFMPILSNRCVNFIASDEVLNTMDYSETWNKYKMVLGTTAKDSRIGPTFAINYMEDQYLTIMKIHKLWIEYVEKVFIGDCISGGVLLTDDLMSNEKRTIDYMVSVYFFQTAPDGETLTYWSRATGCFPVKVPWGELTSEDGGKQDLKTSIPIEYQASYKEDMRIEILRDFNLLQGGPGPSSPKGGYWTGNFISGLPGVGGDKPRIERVTNAQKNYEGVPLFRLVMPTNNS